MLLIWQMMVAMLHSNGQLRTEKDGDTEKGCQNLLYSIRLLMMMMIALHVLLPFQFYLCKNESNRTGFLSENKMSRVSYT